jgi:hypothetical protein
MASNTKVTPGVVLQRQPQRLAVDIHYADVKNVHTTEYVLLTLHDRDWFVRSASAKNANDAEQMLLKTVRDRTEWVRRASVITPNASKPVSKRPSIDTTQRICNAVAFRKTASTTTWAIRALGG